MSSDSKRLTLSVTYRKNLIVASELSMSIKRTDSGWLVDIQPGGRGSKRYRKTLSTKAEALAYEAWLTTKIIQKPERAPQKRDLRHLSDLIALWFKHHGHQSGISF